MRKTISKAIDCLVEKSTREGDGIKAMQFAQAALNLGTLAQTIELIDDKEKNIQTR